MIALWLFGLLLSTTPLPANGQPVVIEPQLGLPQLAIPDNNPLTTEKIALGQMLFFDRRLSPTTHCLVPCVIFLIRGLAIIS